MFGKFLLAFLCLGVIAAQANPISPVESTDAELYISIQEIIKAIQKFIKTLEENFWNIIQAIKDKIQEIIGSSSVQEIVKKVIEWIKGKLGQAGEKVEECIKKEMPTINQIAEETQKAMMKCVSDANGDIQKLKDRVTGIKDEAIAYGKKAASAALKCAINSHPTECLQGVYQGLKQKFSDILDEAKQIAADAQKLLASVALCSQNAQEAAQVKFQKVYEDLVKCVVPGSRKEIKIFYH